MLGGRRDGELRPSAGGLRYLVADGGEVWQGLHGRAAVILAGGGAGMVGQRSIWPVRRMAGAGTARRRSIWPMRSMEASYASTTALNTIEPLHASRIRRRMCR
jgi:hypothetical protein